MFRLLYIKSIVDRGGLLDEDAEAFLRDPLHAEAPRPCVGAGLLGEPRGLPGSPLGAEHGPFLLAKAVI